MRWTGVATGLLVALAATVCLAETPEMIGSGPIGGQLRRGQLFSGPNWWTRYGEPVNVSTFNQPAKEVIPAGAISLHGPDYIYGLGACDCPPPCVDHLWDGYVQHPKRCDGYVPWLGRHKCHGCGDCMSCTKAAVGCGEPVGCAVPLPPKVIGCADVAPSCDCGRQLFGHCKQPHFHLGHKMKHLKKGRCHSCAAPVSCGCATPLDFGPPPLLMPEKQSPLSLPIPAAEDAAFLSLPRIK